MRPGGIEPPSSVPKTDTLSVKLRALKLLPIYYTKWMLALFVYLLILLSLLFFLIFISVYTLFLIYSSIKGAPYVPSKQKEINVILEELKPKSGKYLIELGSGDGRMTRTAVKKYHLKGLGVDVNHMLVFWSRILASWEKLKGKAVFKIEDVFKTDLTKADYLYIFLMPALVDKLIVKMKVELKEGTIIIAHGFPIPAFKKKLYKTLKRTPFPTYFYEI